ncbi:MAG: glycosyl hydrolase [Rhodothermales bacterium]|nr:glycosyl hydrolase [Rhodothermales bacterium]
MTAACTTPEPEIVAGFQPQAAEALLDDTIHAVAYSGFRSGQHPDRGEGAVFPSREEILEDLNLLQQAGLTLIRLYDSQQNSRDVLEVIREQGLPHKVMLGVWLNAEKSNHETCAWLTEPIPKEKLEANRLGNQVELQRGIALANEFDEIVVAMNVGNETLVDWNDHGVPVESQKAYMDQARPAIDQPVTTAENYEAWIAHASTIAESVDFAGVHTYPAWENKTVVQAIDYSIDNLRRVQEAMPEVPIAIVEAGWASQASEFGPRASEAKQVRHHDELMAWARANNVTTFWFEAFDEDWKGNPDNPLGAEKHWGLWRVDRTPKAVVSADRLPLAPGR